MKELANLKETQRKGEVEKVKLQKQCEEQKLKIENLSRLKDVNEMYTLEIERLEREVDKLKQERVNQEKFSDLVKRVENL